MSENWGFEKVRCEEFSFDAVLIGSDFQTWFCDLCGEAGIGKMSSIDHLLQQHPPRALARCDCGASFQTSLQAMDHLRSDHLLLGYICLRCNKHIKTSERLAEHTCNE